MKIDQIQKEIEIKIDNRIFTLQSESLYNRCPNLLESNFELLMIRFWDPNRLSINRSTIKFLQFPRHSLRHDYKF